MCSRINPPIPGNADIPPLVDKIRNCQTRKLDAKSPSTSSILRTDPSVVGNTLLEKCRIGADHLCLLLQPFRRRFDDRSPPGRTMNGIVHTFETTSSGNTGLAGLGPSPTSATTVPRPKLSPDSALQSRPRMEHLTAPNNQWKRILLSRICSGVSSPNH